jgi:hypothetical protein
MINFLGWKMIAFIVLMSYVTASASDTETTQWKRFVAMIFGLYATSFFAVLIMVLDLRMLE